MILDSSVDRLLLVEMSYCFERYSGLGLHQKDNYATHPIARFPGSQASLLRLAWNGHAALSPLQGAFALACANRFAGSQHAARNPCSTLAQQPGKRTLGCVQLRNLGLMICFFYSQ